MVVDSCFVSTGRRALSFYTRRNMNDMNDMNGPRLRKNKTPMQVPVRWLCDRGLRLWLVNMLTLPFTFTSICSSAALLHTLSATLTPDWLGTLD